MGAQTGTSCSGLSAVGASERMARRRCWAEARRWCGATGHRRASISIHMTTPGLSPGHGASYGLSARHTMSHRGPGLHPWCTRRHPVRRSAPLGRVSASERAGPPRDRHRVGGRGTGVSVVRYICTRVAAQPQTSGGSTLSTASVTALTGPGGFCHSGPQLGRLP